ncbi:MAG: hypothetical protein K8L99_30580, partial [Anaerolineae bacterium]|nr:hypothetical protein [Anaerolineae bacterium]
AARRNRTMKKSAASTRWRKLLLEWSKSGVSLAGFARQKDLSYWTLWDWKKRLGIEPARPANGQKKSNNQKAANKPEFLPVQIIDHSRELLTTHQESRSSAVELIVARDYTMRFDENCALDFVSRVVTMLEER